jgi:hypothetical protein
MRSPVVFDEPAGPTPGPYTGLADWYRNSGSADARSARADINAWYAVFPDRTRRLLSRLQSTDDLEIEQATDELFAHHLLPSSYEARYEEDETSPDFRLYQSPGYIAGIEVLTLFPEEAFASLIARNDALVREINRRVPADRWLLKIDIVDWKRQPRVTDIARWLEQTVAALPPPTPGMTRDDYPTAVYSTDQVEIVFDFIPHRITGASSTGGSIVGIGPAAWGFSQSVTRLRRNLRRKVAKYELHDRPYAVLASIRDISCDMESVFDALYGSSAIQFPRDNPDAAVPIRKGDGLFGRSATYPDGKNRRLSCVFTLMRDWAPGRAENTTIVRFDNPFSHEPFPDDVIAPTKWFAAVRDDSGVRMEWQSGPP